MKLDITLSNPASKEWETNAPWHSYLVCVMFRININPFKPEFTIVISIHYKPRIAVAILDL